ncbi:MAG: hypothetical protein HY315_07915 [Acidobacteria bacterium]|nr:hypothetical protein [Acidobacteriota bacterium]
MQRSSRTITGTALSRQRRLTGTLLILAALALLLPAGAGAQAKLDTTTFIVVGEGLAAGMADFALREVYQDKSFPSQMARQMKSLFPQPLIQSPGIGSAPGFASLPPRLPGILQGSVRTPFPPYLFVFNLSVPGLRLADSLNRRPSAPVIQQRDPQQTVINFILGYPALIAGANLPLWTQAEYAVQMNPTFVVVELGYYDVLESAVRNDPGLLPDVTTFRNNFTALLSRLSVSSPQILVLTIPDPFDTAFFTALTEATRLVGAPPATLVSRFRLRSDDLLTPNGLTTVGNLILGDVRPDASFPGLAAANPGTVVSAATQTAVRSRVQALNTEVAGLARQAGANVYDLKALLTRIKSNGLQAGSKTLTADFLGGFYSLDGYYPGVTGHALIANELLQLLNQTYRTSYPLLDLAGIAADDPAIRFTPAIKYPDPVTEELQ